MIALFVFDFDGVLFETAFESLEVAYQAVRGEPQRWGVPAAFVAPARPDPSLRATFREHRYLVGPPWQYALLLGCIAAGQIPANSDEFVALAARRRPELESFTQTYFEQRGVLSTDRERWLALVEPVGAALQVFVELHRRGLAKILSTRDDQSITTLLRHYARVEVSRDDLLPRAGPREKWQILVDAAAERSIERERMFFLDDYVHHALPAYEHGVAANLATWGYLGPGDLEKAHSAGLPALSLAQLAANVRNFEENRT